MISNIFWALVVAVAVLAAFSYFFKNGAGKIPGLNWLPEGSAEDPDRKRERFLGAAAVAVVFVFLLVLFGWEAPRMTAGYLESGGPGWLWLLIGFAILGAAVATAKTKPTRAAAAVGVVVFGGWILLHLIVGYLYYMPPCAEDDTACWVRVAAEEAVEAERQRLIAEARKPRPASTPECPCTTPDEDDPWVLTSAWDEFNPGKKCDPRYAITKGTVEFDVGNGKSYTVSSTSTAVGLTGQSVPYRARCTTGSCEGYLLLAPDGKAPDDGSWTCKLVEGTTRYARR